MQNWGTVIDTLSTRRAAMVLYHLPNADDISFCMAADGSTRRQGEGFLVADFEGNEYVIPNELTSPPSREAAEAFPPLRGTTPAPVVSRSEYACHFSRAKAELAAGRLAKVVLARTADVPLDAPLSPWRAFCAAVSAFPALFTVLVHTPMNGTWLCSTPELLLQGSGNKWETMALAGTRPCSDAPWDAKNTREQAVVADYVHSVLTRHADAVQQDEVCNLNSGSIEHRCTRFRFTMAAAQRAELLSELPPTPAVSGFPVAAARRYLNEQPDINRGLYAGYMGEWGQNSARLYVSLRCMQLFPDRCRLYAGGGIMPDSEEEAEWLETEAKCAAMRRVIDACQA